MLLLPLLGCESADIPYHTPLALEMTSPTYGAFIGDGPVTVTGVVTPAWAQIIVNRVAVVPDAEGVFTAEVAIPAGERALVLDVFALQGDEQIRAIIPVFDGTDPRLTDPGAIGGLLTPAGLDALEPLVAEQIDALGWQDQILAALPAFESDYVSLVPSSVTADDTTVDLAPADGSVAFALTLNDVTLTTDVTVLNAYTFPIDITLGVISVGASGAPDLANDMLTLVLSDAEVVIDEVGFGAGGFEVPDWITDLLVDPVFALAGDLGALLGDLLLDQLGELELGGPFAFDADLLGTPLSARLVDVDATLDGVSLGATISTDGAAPDVLPALPALGATTPAGLPYQLGASVHEGLLNTLLDDTLASFLDIDLQLEGGMAEALGGGIRALPGGDDIPNDSTGFCLGLHAGDARVVRMAPGTGAPLASALLPDLRVNIEVIEEGSCNDWLEASVFAAIDLSLEGTTVNADLHVRSVRILDYRASDDVSRDETAEALGAVVEGLAGLLAGQLQLDLGDLAGGLGGIALDPRVVSVEPLDATGQYGVFLDVF